MKTLERVDVAIVGGGPAGAALAARLAGAGREVVVLERSLAWHWRACGVFASPAAIGALRGFGLDEAILQAVARPIPAMRVETPAGTTFRLTYGAERVGGPEAVGFDRSGLDPALLRLAAEQGADVRAGASVTAVDLETGTLTVRDASRDGTLTRIQATVIVGADGLRSVVAGSAGVERSVSPGGRVGLTFHLEDPGMPSTPGMPGTPGTPGTPGARDARMCILRDGYVGIAPVPGGRVNIGIVLGRSWRSRLAAQGARTVTEAIVGAIAPTPDDSSSWRFGRRCDPIAGASPLGHRVTRRAGVTGGNRGWLLVGDAAGFLDPFTGEGLHRALVSAELAGRALLGAGSGRAGALAAYDRQMRRQFMAKDAVSALVQAFLGRPALFEYAARRLASRPGVRATMGLVMGDLVPASRGLDPRYLAALLAP